MRKVGERWERGGRERNETYVRDVRETVRDVLYDESVVWEM